MRVQESSDRLATRLSGTCDAATAAQAAALVERPGRLRRGLRHTRVRTSIATKVQTAVVVCSNADLARCSGDESVSTGTLGRAQPRCAGWDAARRRPMTSSERPSRTVTQSVRNSRRSRNKADGCRRHRGAVRRKRRAGAHRARAQERAGRGTVVALGWSPEAFESLLGLQVPSE